MNSQQVNILMLSAGLISGAFQMMLDIIQNINKKNFQIYVAYKPEYAEWGKYEVDAITESSAKIIPLRGKSLFDLKGFLDLWTSLHKEKIDILHCWDVLGVPARIIGKISGVKIVEEFANPPPLLNSQISYKHYMINKLTSPLVNGFIACSNEIMKKYKEKKPLFLNNKHLAVVHNCVDISHINMSKEKVNKIRLRYSLHSHEKVLTNIGYFNEQKAHDDLLLAFKRIVDQRSDVKLIIVGWGRLENEIKQFTKYLGLQDKVIFTGKLVRPEVFEVLSITDLFVLSSHWEGFGIVLAEAMALGKPVVATETDGSREVVEDGESGILVPIKNPQVMAKVILDLLEQPDLMIRMGQKGTKRVKELFNPEQFIKGYEDFYKTVYIS
jgi:glycosyltransferase involved in cell wall biosynthesis